MIYLDTNVIVYAIENHPKFGSPCKRILRDIDTGKLEAAASMLVLAELLNVLTRLNETELKRGEKLDLEKNVRAVLSLPLLWLEMDLSVIERASRYSFDLNGIDYVHVATMELNAIGEILSADAGFDRVGAIRRTDPLVYSPT